MDSTDIFIAGGGIAGLVAAAFFARSGYSVMLADPNPAVETAEADGSDLRSTAFLQPSIALLDRAGMWDALRPNAMPLDALRAVDTQGWPPEPRDQRLFQSADLGNGPFGWNLPNWQTRHTAMALLREMPNVTLRIGTRVTRTLTRTREAFVWLDDGTQVKARLLVAADGRNSTLRQAAGIKAQTTRYGQKALAFAITHDAPHDNISTEIYNQGGAFTLVPLPDAGGKPASSVVWMNDGAEAERLAALPEAAFNTAMTERSAFWLGPLHLASLRRMWPIITQRAERLTATRLALIAEAAHVMPPIGAQGLNTSLQDVGALCAALEKAPGDPGAAPVLADYSAQRARDVALRATAIDLFNRICRSGLPPVQSLRLAGLRAVHDIALVRKAVMRAGMGG